MSLGIAFKGPEGVVLAADSRVTLSGPLPGTDLLVQAHYDNATKLLKVEGHDYVGAITYGLGALGGRRPRTARSYLPEFEAELAARRRLHVEGFAARLGEFFLGRWSAADTPPGADPMVFLVGGFDEGTPTGASSRFRSPARPSPSKRALATSASPSAASTRWRGAFWAGTTRDWRPSWPRSCARAPSKWRR